MGGTAVREAKPGSAEPDDIPGYVRFVTVPTAIYRLITAFRSEFSGPFQILWTMFVTDHVFPSTCSFMYRSS